MASDVDICNIALTQKFVDRGRISALTADEPAAKDCNAIFTSTRDRLLRSHDWNFARKRVQLAQSTTTPATEFDYQYDLPADWIRTVTVADNDNAIPGVVYRQEGRVILCSATTVYLTYIYRITDPAQFNDDFVWLFAMDLACQLALTSTGRDEARKERKSAWNRATSAESIEDYPKSRPQGSWTTRRFGLGRDIYRA